METKKRRWGDRKDGELLRDVDPMHFVVPVIFPNRCDNEAFISERIDLSKLNAYLERKNAGDPEYPLKLFYVVVAAVARTCLLRPKMNRFIANRNLYQRNELTAAFVVKKVFADNGEEGMVKLTFTGDDTMDSVKERIVAEISSNRGGKVDSSSESMDIFNRMPRFLSKLILWVISRLDVHGWVPASLIETDPYYCSIVLTNLGSIKLHAGYHHLGSWGTNSVFIAIGERKKRPYYLEDGSVEMRDSLDLGLTVDERIADGYYFSKTIRLMKKLLENPELLEQRFDTAVEY